MNLQAEILRLKIKQDKYLNDKRANDLAKYNKCFPSKNTIKVENEEKNNITNIPITTIKTKPIIPISLSAINTRRVAYEMGLIKI